MLALGVGGRSESGVVVRQRRWPSVLLPIGCVALLLAFGSIASSFADNVVSKPVGFVRLTATSNQEILVSIPFDAFDASINAVLKGQLIGATNAEGADHVFKWDVSGQQYLSAFLADDTGQTNRDGLWFEDDVNWITSTLAFHPGEGFWIESRHPGTQAVYLAGTIVLAGTNSVTLGPALNLFSYPFSSRIALNNSDLAADGAYAASSVIDADMITDVASNRNFWLLDDTNSANHWKWLDEDNVLANEFLTLGRGYWYNRRTTNEFTWSEPRPYADPFPRDNNPPCVTAMTFNAQGDQVTLCISARGVSGETLEIYYQDFSPTNAFDSTNGWKIAAQGLSTSNQTDLQWIDNGSGGRGAITVVFARYYVVARSDIDSDGDGLPDARETFIYHTSPATSDTDGDGMSDGWEVLHGFNPLVHEAGGVPQSGLRLWLQADDLALTNGAGVSVWRDQSGQGHDLSQGVTNGRPTYEAGALNGRAAVHFDGTNDGLVGALGSLPAPLTMVVVSRFDQLHQGSNDYDYVAKIGQDVTNSCASINRFCLNPPQGSQYSDHYYALQGANGYVTGPELLGQTWTILTAEHGTNAPRHGLWMDGVEQTVGSYAQSVGTDGSIELGRYSKLTVTNHYLKGSIAEVLVYEKTLSQAEREAVEGYLKIKYGMGCTDCDGDGMPDAWELQYFGNTTNTAAGDFDGDAVNNLREYQRGTNPTNALSVNVTLYASSLIGSNVYDGLSATVTNGHGPKLNIQAAALDAVSGDNVSIAEGTYREAILETDTSINLVPNGVATVDPN